MDADLSNHYLDTGIILNYLQLDSRGDNVIDAYMSSRFNKCTSTTPKNQYNKLCDRVRAKASKFLTRLKNNPKLAQSNDLSKAICDEFTKFSNDELTGVSEFVKRKVTSFVKAGVPEIVKAVERGRVLQDILQDCSKRTYGLWEKLRNNFSDICHEGADALIKLHEVYEYQADDILNNDELKPAFEYVKGKDRDILAEAYYVRTNILRINRLCLVTTKRWAFLDLSPKHAIQTHLAIHPMHPADILRYSKSS